jgi:colicin import membrane protein
MNAGYVNMATASVNERITGTVGIAAVIVFVAAMLAAVITKGDFDFGNGKIDDLISEQVYVVGCVIAGILGAAFGLLITYKKAESKVFIGKVRGLLIILSGAALVLIGLTEGASWSVYLFIALVILSAASDIFYNWVAEQKMLMVISLMLALFITVTGILSQTGDNYIMGFAFALFAAAWVLLLAVMRFAPVVGTEPEKAKKGPKAKDKKETKKNAPAPRPYPANKEPARAPKKAATEKVVYTENNKKIEKPKKEEPKKEEPAAEPKAKEEPPKLKVMSSREAAAAREARMKEELVAEPEPEPKREEPVPEPEPPAAEFVAETEADEEVEEEYFDDFEIAEDTPDALLRRATWNKGLRCRRDYGEDKIPIAFVKAKVAVYVLPGAGDTSADEKLIAAGWKVLRYLESDITDGKEQAEEINKVVKENLRAERAAKKKKSKK